MARLRSYFALGALASFIVLACASEPGDTGGGSGGSGGTVGPASGGTSPGSGGQPSSGGTSTGGMNTGGTSSGGSEGDGDGGLGGEAATGGSEAAGGAEGVGGTGGARAVGYGPCDEALGSEGNPDCSDGELCVANTCTELCPLNDVQAALAYECPASPPGGEAINQCNPFIGRCYLTCAVQGGPTYTCPDGMVCEAFCRWPD